jgi:hypothetical protein
MRIAFGNISAFAGSASNAADPADSFKKSRRLITLSRRDHRVSEEDGALHLGCRDLRENSNADAASDADHDAFVARSRAGTEDFFLRERRRHSLIMEQAAEVPRLPTLHHEKGRRDRRPLSSQSAFEH